MSILPSVASIPEDLMSSFGLYRQQAHMWCMYINSHKIHIKKTLIHVMFMSICSLYKVMFMIFSSHTAIFTPLPSSTSSCYFTFISILLQSALPFSFALPSKPRSNYIEYGSLASGSQNYETL